VLRLHPEMVMVVVITGSGGIAKKIIVFDQPVDAGLVDWARGFLGEVVCGLEMGSRRLKLRLEEQELSASERAFIKALAPALSEPPAGGAGLYLEGASRLFSRLEQDGGRQTRSLMELLDRQEEVLGLLREALDERSVYLRIGRELPRTAMQGCSFVAAGYGVARRSLGVVGVLGPTRMDYPGVIGSVRYAADRLSRYVEEIYQ
jgi:heat-inducible transcriptional repressor